MMLRFTTPRVRRDNGTKTPEWTWQARIPAMILAYGAAILAVLVVERFVHSAQSAFYAAIAVVPGGLAAGICAFALSFVPRPRLLIMAAVVIVALIPLGVIALSFDFQEYRPLFDQRAPLVAAVLTGATTLVTGFLILGGVFPSPESAR